MKGENKFQKSFLQQTWSDWTKQHEISRRGTKSARKSSENFRELNENENIVIRTLRDRAFVSDTIHAFSGEWRSIKKQAKNYSEN